MDESFFGGYTLAKRVFPVPGGPKSRIPMGGALKPVKISGRLAGRMTVYFNSFFFPLLHTSIKTCLA